MYDKQPGKRQKNGFLVSPPAEQTNIKKDYPTHGEGRTVLTPLFGLGSFLEL